MNPHALEPPKAHHRTLGAARGAGIVVLALLVVAGAGAFFLSVKSAGGPGGPTPANGAPAPIDLAKLDAVLSASRDYLDKGEPEKADAILVSAIGQNAEEQGLYTLHAEVLLALKRLPEAYDAYEKALAIGPRTGEIEFAAGTVATMLDRHERSLEHYAAAQYSLKSDYRPSLFLAQVQLKLRQTEEAKANLILAGKLNPDAGVIWGTLSQIALDENALGLAIQHAARARELEPRVTLWRLVEARALRRQGQPERALELLTGLDDSEKRDRNVLTLMAECYGMLGKPAQSAAIVRAAADATPTDASLALETALWLEKAGDKPTALKYAEHAGMLGAEGAGAVIARLKG